MVFHTRTGINLFIAEAVLADFSRFGLNNAKIVLLCLQYEMVGV